MNDVLLNVLIGLVAVSGGYVTAWVNGRKSRRDDRQTLIDQLQEERNTYATQLEKERAEYMTRLDRMWTDKAMTREHVAALRDHIWQRKAPPPPVPPAGYIE